MHSPSHIYIRKSIENTEKNPYLFSYLLYYTYSYYYSMQHFPGRGVICHKRRRLAAILPRVFFHSFETHPKTTGLLPLLIFSHPSLKVSLLFGCFETPLWKEKTNKKHAASLFQRGYDSRRERESEAGERGAIEREANGTSSFDFFFL